MGRIILERFNGKEVFEFETGSITVNKGEKEHQIVFSVFADGTAVQSLDDTKELMAEPSAELLVYLDDFSDEELNAKVINIPSAYDSKKNEHIATFYYVSHEDLNENIIELKHVDNNTFHVNWSGTTMDVNYYDGSKPNTKVLIIGDFVKDDIQE